MTHPLTGQRSRAELIAELYVRHAAGLFAYCADQLGDQGSATDTVVSVLAGVPAAPPPRAALFAFARREIRRRDVVYVPPVVDPLIDPASALVERTLRELRPHQREVLVLCEVCGLNRAELAWVLDVAPDTADELATSAAHRFRLLLDAALTVGAAKRVPKPVADVYGALGVAPLRDVLGRLTWPSPPRSLEEHYAAPRVAPPPVAGTAAPMFVKPLWPGPPTWPQPLGETDPATSTGLFPVELLTPPSPGRVAPHEATTAPMAMLRPPAMSPQPFPRALPPAPGRSTWSAFGAPRPPTPGERDRPLGVGRPFVGPALPETARPAPGPAAAPARPLPADVLDDDPVTEEIPVIPAVGDMLVYKAPTRQPAKQPAKQPAIQPAIQPAKQAGGFFTPRRKGEEPVYKMPNPPILAPAPPIDEPAAPPPAESGSGEENAEARALPRATESRVRWRVDRHYDWAWELIGFVICVAIAMLVFFAIPAILDP